eukprot:Nk52_evm3s233 gene=Nk52_evmTU3s233
MENQGSKEGHEQAFEGAYCSGRDAEDSGSSSEEEEELFQIFESYEEALLTDFLGPAGAAECLSHCCTPVSIESLSHSGTPGQQYVSANDLQSSSPLTREHHGMKENLLNEHLLANQWKTFGSCGLDDSEAAREPSRELDQKEECEIKRQLAYLFCSSLGSFFEAEANCGHLASEAPTEEIEIETSCVHQRVEKNYEDSGSENICAEEDAAAKVPVFKNGIFSKLSEEMYVSILEYLDDVDLQELRTVNRRFYRLSTDPLLWKHLYEKHSRALKKKLLQRPERKELMLQNILKSNANISANLLPIQETLLRKLRASQLIRQVRQRSNPIDLERQRILMDPVHVATLVCPPIRSKIQHFSQVIDGQVTCRQIKSKEGPSC